MGDPAGIGPDITLQAWQRRDESIPVFAVLADPDVLTDRAAGLSLDVPIRQISTIKEAETCFQTALPLLPVTAPEINVKPGQPDTAYAEAVTGAIEEAVRLTYEGQASAMVTCPINKAVLYDAGFRYPGHTEFLGALAAEHGDEATPVMMLSAEGLRVVPATIHIPLKDVPSALSQKKIVDNLIIMANELRRSFSVPNPTIAVTGLNPHAGENGALGKEEADLIIPAMETARSKGLTLTGPHPADTLFHDTAREKYDAVLAMYHDQALIPVKTIGFDKGVNITLGLPFIRTSPDHGTAYDIAGTGKANPQSLMEALKMADFMARNRSENETAAV